MFSVIFEVHPNKEQFDLHKQADQDSFGICSDLDGGQEKTGAQRKEVSFSIFLTAVTGIVIGLKPNPNPHRRALAATFGASTFTSAVS